MRNKWAAVVTGARRTGRYPGGWLAAAIALAAGSPARAEQETVELRYAAPAECPSRAAFEAAILERAPNVRLAAPAQRVFAITIETTADGFRGALVVDRVADKELAAPSCVDLTSALALVTALAIDPSAGPQLVPAIRVVRRMHMLEADLDAMIEAGVGPGALFAGALEVRWGPSRLYALELAAIAGRDSVTHDGAEARFTWLAARPAACVLGAAGRVALDACGHVELGAVLAAGAMIINQRDRTRLWLTAGLHGNARYPLGAHGFGLLQLGASVPLVRDRYLFAPNVTVHATPGVTAWLVLGVGLRFR